MIIECGKQPKLSLICVAVLIAAQTALMLFVCMQKDGLHEDEGFTLTINGSFAEDDFPAVSNEWTRVDSWDRLYSVADEDRFDYAAIYDETLSDAVHPPLYYLALFTLESIAPAAVTKWYGLIFNLIFFAGTQIALWFTGRLLFMHRYYALVPLLLYGFSFGALNTVTFLRMYAMLTFFAVLFVLALCGLMLEKNRLPLTALLGFAGFCGVMTHYYFILFAVPSAFLYIIWLAVRKKWAMLLISAAVGCLAVFAVFRAHPHIWWQLTGSYRGAQAFANIAASDNDKENILEIFKVIRASAANICEDVASAAVLIGVAVLLLSIILCLKLVRSKREAAAFRFFLRPSDLLARPRRCFCGILLLTAVFNILCVARIAPYQEDRYLMQIFPVFSLLAAALFFAVSLRFGIPKRVLSVSVSLFLAFFCVVSYHEGTNYLYAQDAAARILREDTRSIPAVCVTIEAAGWERYSLLPELLRYKPDARIYIQDYLGWQSDPDKRRDILDTAKEMSAAGSVTLFVANKHADYFEPELMAKQMSDAGSFSRYDYLYSVPNWDVYILV